MFKALFCAVVHLVSTMISGFFCAPEFERPFSWRTLRISHQAKCFSRSCAPFPLLKIEGISLHSRDRHVKRSRIEPKLVDRLNHDRNLSAHPAPWVFPILPTEAHHPLQYSGRNGQMYADANRTYSTSFWTLVLHCPN